MPSVAGTGLLVAPLTLDLGCAQSRPAVEFQAGVGPVGPHIMQKDLELGLARKGLAPVADFRAAVNQAIAALEGDRLLAAIAGGQAEGP